MAVYAAYRHIELDNIGYGKKRVLKPPGGGSSDIFGVDPAEPRRVRNTNHLQSSVFGDAMETASTKSGNPVTGEGYAIANGVKEVAAAPAPASPAAPVQVNGDVKKTNGVQAPPPSAPASRGGRVPPGGYSSGLW